MRAVLTAPPVGLLVEIQDLRDQCRIDGDYQDAKLDSYQMAAVGHLDGCYGALGRCILPQTWAVTLQSAGCYRLPVPDVSEVSASAGTATLEYDGLWPTVHVTEACTVSFIAGMPEGDVEVARQIVRFMVAQWMDAKEGVVIGSISSMIPMTADFLIAGLRRGLL